MVEEINIRTAELAIGREGQILKTGSVGSCLVIILYDKINKVGGLAHAMLPSSQSHGITDTEGMSQYQAKYVDQAIDNLIIGIEQAGGKKRNLLAKLVGGASMFKKLTAEKNGIGQQNTQRAKEKLAEYQIPVESEDTGGSSGKMLEFDLKNGIVEVSSKI